MFQIPRIICMVLSIFLSISSHAENSICENQHCLAIVDAGSTGSRLHIYSYDIDDNKTANHIKELYSRKIKPGLATLDANEESINQYLKNLFSEAPTSPMPLYFYSTAGMRLLPKQKQQPVYDSLENWFANQSQWDLKSAKTITGKEEGLFGWLSINYQLGALKHSNNKPVAVMDMGGASVQVSFPVKSSANISSDDLQDINVYGKHYRLFIHSFLGLGQTEVSHQFLETSSCFANDYEMPSGQKALGDAKICAKKVSHLINKVHRVNHRIEPVITKNPIRNWFVIGGLAELAQSYPFQVKDKQFTNKSLLDTADQSICQQSWLNLNAKYSKNDYLYSYCFLPSYYYALLVKGYGISPTQPINYLSSEQGDWTLGVVILKANA